MRYNIKSFDCITYYCEDMVTGLKVQWIVNEFNYTNKFITKQVATQDADDLAHLITEMSDWLSAYHYNLVMQEQSNEAVLIHQIKTIRKMRGISQVEVAGKCGMFQPAYAMVETGKRVPNLSTLCKIADALGCEVRLVEK